MIMNNKYDDPADDYNKMRSYMRSHRFIVTSHSKELDKRLLCLKSLCFSRSKYHDLITLIFFLHDELLPYLVSPNKFGIMFLISFVDSSGKRIGHHLKVIGVKHVGEVNWNRTLFDYTNTCIQTISIDFNYNKKFLFYNNII